MTQLSMLYEEGKIEYGNQKAEATAKKVIRRLALKMLDEGIDIIKIMKITGLTEEELVKLQRAVRYCTACQEGTIETTYDTSDYWEFLQAFGAGQEDIYRKFKDLKKNMNISWEEFSRLKWDQINLENGTVTPLSI